MLLYDQADNMAEIRWEETIDYKRTNDRLEEYSKRETLHSSVRRF